MLHDESMWLPDQKPVDSDAVEEDEFRRVGAATMKRYDLGDGGDVVEGRHRSRGQERWEEAGRRCAGSRRGGAAAGRCGRTVPLAEGASGVAHRAQEEGSCCSVAAPLAGTSGSATVPRRRGRAKDGGPIVRVRSVGAGGGRHARIFLIRTVWEWGI